jgi:hypothetical protein
MDGARLACVAALEIPLNRLFALAYLAPLQRELDVEGEDPSVRMRRGRAWPEKQRGGELEGVVEFDKLFAGLDRQSRLLLLELKP